MRRVIWRSRTSPSRFYDNENLEREAFVGLLVDSIPELLHFHTIHDLDLFLLPIEGKNSNETTISCMCALAQSFFQRGYTALWATKPWATCLEIDAVHV